MDRFSVRITPNIPATPGAKLSPKQDEQPGVDKPAREAISGLCVAGSVY